MPHIVEFLASAGSDTEVNRMTFRTTFRRKFRRKFRMTLRMIFNMLDLRRVSKEDFEWELDGYFMGSSRECSRGA